ncbi:MAG: sugar phosphate isomerase/epimerase [Bacteroidota bacterium]|nr:sugar phosphate isomerase/epimerase [Bacteroidota bacterium]
MNRRTLLKAITASSALPFLPSAGSSQTTDKSPHSFIYCINMATIRGHKLGFVKELEVASKAGFKAVEIWMDSLQSYVKEGGTLKDAKKRLDDLGIKVENTIGFAPWIIDDEAKRKEGLEQMKREMDMLAQIGCKRTAAPPVGATANAGLDLKLAAERYHAILELGDRTGVIPQLEMWGHSKNLSRVSEVMYVALESAHPSARILLDIFHLYKGGSSIDTLPLVNPEAVEILHMNDYPSLPPSTITDAARVYPGDGTAPIHKILKILGKRQKPLVLSVEVFNKDYYAQDALVVAKTALLKLKAVSAGV